MLRLLQCLMIAFSVVGMTACASFNAAEPGQSLPIPDSTTSVSPGDVRIAPLDVVEVDFFGVPDLDGQYQVDLAGAIKLPLIGAVPAVGKTSSELAFDLEDRYEESYLQDPDVTVTIVESIGRRFTVDGSVKNPGLFPMSGELSLLQAVALAGGPSDTANPRKVVVFRQVNGERRAAAFDLISIRKGNAEDPKIYGNDLIVVDGSEARASYGELLRSLPVLAFFLAL